ncbi:MAG: serine hydrolase domain-containing protein [Acidobacteriota bacterium]
MNAILHTRRCRFGLALVSILAGLWLQALAIQETPPAGDPSATEQPPSAGPQSEEELEAFLDGIMAAHMESRKIPAATISVVKDGRLMLAKGYGWANRKESRPVDPARSLFRPGSISKLFTWTAVMQLAEQGQLDLEADVNSYLTQFQIPDTYPEPITMKHLLTHTPGFEDGGLGYLFAAEPDRIVPLADSLAAHIPVRVRPPGIYSSYSNYGAALAGLIVSNISALPFNEYIEQHIFDPLGMEHSTFREPLPAHLAEEMAVSYARESGIYKEKPFEYVSNVGPAGALSSTANDMARFMIAHLQLGRFEEVRILQENTARQMHSQLYTLDPRLPGMAHGFYETSLHGQRIIGHGGDTFYFHSNLALFPQHNLGLFVSYATNGSQARIELLDAFVRRYFPAAEEAPAAKAPEDFQSRAQSFSGSYRFTRHNVSTIEKLLALPAALSVSATPDNTLLVQGLQEPSQWVEVEPLLFRQVDGGQTMAFKQDDDGQVSHLFLDSLPFMPAYRIPWYETAGFNLSLLALGILFFLTTVVSAFYHRKQDRQAPASQRRAIRLAVALSALSLLFLIWFAAVVASKGVEIYYGVPASLSAALILPILTSLLTVGTTIYLVLAWKNGYWRLVRRLHYSLFALAALGYVWFYWHWNILGFQY